MIITKFELQIVIWQLTSQLFNNKIAVTMKFFFILFLSLISCAFSINIGYIIPKDDAYDVEEALNKYTSKVNGLLEGDAQFVVKSISSYDGTTEKLRNTFDTFLSDDVKIIVAYCDNTIYEYDFADNYKDLLVWCINPIAPRLCKRNLIAGDLINYSLEMSINIILLYIFSNITYYIPILSQFRVYWWN